MRDPGAVEAGAAKTLVWKPELIEIPSARIAPQLRPSASLLLPKELPKPVIDCDPQSSALTEVVVGGRLRELVGPPRECWREPWTESLRSGRRPDRRRCFP